MEIVVYDQTLKCLVDNQEHKCVDVGTLDFGYLRDQRAKSRQLILRNWNPGQLMVKIDMPIEQGKEHGLSIYLEVFGPLPTDGEDSKKDRRLMREFLLKPNHFILLSLDVELLFNGTSASLPMRISTSVEEITIMLVFRVENGTIALIPQVVRF